jgi:transcriptional regulator with XRE-family HTH domain
VPKNTAHIISIQVMRLLKQERERRELSRYAVAQNSGLSPQMIGYVETGERNPTLETALRIASAIGVDLAQVITEAQALASRSEPARKPAKR